MSFFDPANIFGGGGSRVRDPLGIFGRGGGPMSQQQQQMRQTMGNQRFNAEGPAFGGAGFGGGEREFNPVAQPPAWGGGKSPVQSGGGLGQVMDAIAPQAGGMTGGGLGALQGGLVANAPQVGMAPNNRLTPEVIAHQNMFRNVSPAGVSNADPRAIAQGLSAYGQMRRNRGRPGG